MSAKKPVAKAKDLNPKKNAKGGPAYIKFDGVDGEVVQKDHTKGLSRGR